MKKEFYRFRRIENLLGQYEELEKQIIYFAAPETLNDPMEGFRDFYWKGDFIIWRNLFQHYLFCLDRILFSFLICGEEKTLSIENIPVFSDKNDFPTDEYKNMFAEILKTFFEDTKITKFIEKITNCKTPINKNELHFYLFVIHPYALDIILRAYESHHLIPVRKQQCHKDSSQILKNLLDSNYINHIEMVLAENEKRQTWFMTQKFVISQLDLIYRYNGIINNTEKNKNFVFRDFPDNYLTQIEKLVYPQWYTACFMTECENSSVWGHYGNNHSGVCLVFEVEDNNGYALNLSEIINDDFSDNIIENSAMELYPIEYIEGINQIDFFNMLGNVPMKILFSTWFGLNGKMSSCSNDILHSESEWRENYWNNFYKDITKKTKDWAYEKEYRLILNSMFRSYSNPKDRSFTYDFQSLKGIIFGINTSVEDKLKIIKIIEKKCRKNKRNDFKFYQAYYSQKDKCIKRQELSLIKFTFNSSLVS